MKELSKKIDEAYRMLSTICLSGDAVDVMAAAKANLREVSRKLSDMAQKQDADTESR